MVQMLMPDMVRKANCLLASFPRVDPLVLTRLFQSYCLPLFGSALWSLSCPALYCIEVSFNMILQKVWYFSPSSRVSTIYFFVDPLLLRLQLLSVPLNYFSQSFILLPLCAIPFVAYHNIMFGSRHLKQQIHSIEYVQW